MQPSDAQKFDELCTLLATHFKPKPKAITKIYILYLAYRTQDQPIKDFVAELKNPARNYDFGKTILGLVI